MLVVKEIDFDAAHRLFNYEGNCSNIHGHRWKVIATWKGKPQADGMVCDFKFLKRKLDVIINLLDHKLILNSKDPLALILIESEDRIGKMAVKQMIGNPTAENIAQYIFSMLADGSPEDPLIEQVRVFETATSSAVAGYGL
jgi:6-pyruvoyltetrahydropterin/6-carboxytetrahydropterin synthase